jgi:hypothetical protein
MNDYLKATLNGALPELGGPWLRIGDMTHAM